MPLPATLPPPDVLRELSGRLANIWGVMRRGFAPWARREPGDVPEAACRKAGRLFARVQAILALLAEGRLPRVYPNRPKRAEPPPPGTAETSQTLPEEPRKPRPPPVRLPRRPGWLLRATGRYVDPSQRDSVAGAAGILRWWLAEPAVRVAMEEVSQLRKPLRALCRMLLIAPWPENPTGGDFPPDPPRPRKPRPPKPRRETLAELRASLRHHPCMEIELGLVRPDARPYWLPPFRKPRPRKPG